MADKSMKFIAKALGTTFNAVKDTLTDMNYLNDNGELTEDAKSNGTHYSDYGSVPTFGEEIQKQLFKRFRRIDWYCDNPSCNAYLNRQDGFNKNATTHVCTKCGTVNTLSVDDVEWE